MLPDRSGVNWYPKRHAAAEPLLGVFGVDAVVVVSAQAQAHLRVEQVRLLEGDHVALHLRAGHGLDAEPLAGAAPRRAVADVFPTVGEARPIEVLLVQDDRADQAGVGVDAHAEHQSPGHRLFGRDVERQAAGPARRRRADRRGTANSR